MSLESMWAVFGGQRPNCKIEQILSYPKDCNASPLMRPLRRLLNLALLAKINTKSVFQLLLVQVHAWHGMEGRIIPPLWLTIGPYTLCNILAEFLAKSSKVSF